jgi:hypothetical protein
LPTLFTATANAQGKSEVAPTTDTTPPKETRRWSLPALVGEQGMPTTARYLSYFALVFVVMRWWKMSERRRAQRFSLFGVVAAAFWGTVLLFLWPRPEEPYGVVALVLAAIIIQLVSPWEPPPAPKAKKLRLANA